MPRKKLIRSNQHVYHISSRSNSKEWFYISSCDCWKICVDLLIEGKEKFGIEIHAFVLMNNHYHLMARFPEEPIDQFMYFFNKNISFRINRLSGRINHVFGGSYKWSLINVRAYYFNTIKYVYQNPIRAKICSRVELYPYSTFYGSKYGLEVKSYIDNFDLEWLNDCYQLESVERIRKGFKKQYFKPSYNHKRRNICLD